MIVWRLVVKFLAIWATDTPEDNWAVTWAC